MDRDPSFEEEPLLVWRGRLLANSKPMDRSKRDARRTLQSEIRQIESEPWMQEVWTVRGFLQLLSMAFVRIGNPGPTVDMLG